MTKGDIRVGVTLRVVQARWDATAGTLAVVDTVRQSSRFVEWCFTVRWHRSPPNKRALHRDTSLNLFESDLPDFEVFTGPLPAIDIPSGRRRKGILLVSPSPQLALPYTADEFVSDRVGDDWHRMSN